MSDLVIEYGVSLFKVGQLLILLLPSTVAVTVPMAFLVGILLTYSRIVQDNEYHGMQASGISVRSIVLPSIYLAVFVTIIMILFNNYVLPAANLTYKKIYYDIIQKRSGMLIQKHVFINSFDDYVFYIGDKDSKNDLLKNVIVFVKDNTSPDTPAKVILSREGEIINDDKSYRLALKLKNGIIQLGSYADPDKLSQIFYNTNYVDLDIKGLFKNRNEPDDIKGTREMTGEEIAAEIKKGKESKHDKNWLFIEFHKKFSIPFAVIAFAIVGIPLGLMTKKGGRIGGIAFSLVLIFIYYVLLSTGQNYGYKGQWNYFLAVWLPNIFLVGFGLLLLVFMAIRPYFKKKVSLG
jgi:lipopolysaccharide export system permease protein